MHDKRAWRWHQTKKYREAIDLCDALGVKYNAIRIETDALQRIWIADDEGGLYRIDQHVLPAKPFLKVGQKNKNAASLPVYSIIVDRSENLWLGTDGRGLLKADLKQSGFQRFPDAYYSETREPLFIKQVVEDNYPFCWLNTYNFGLLRFNLLNRTYQKIEVPLPTKAGSTKNEPDFITLDKDGNLLAATAYELFIQKKGNNRFTHVVLPRAGIYNNAEANRFNYIHLYKNDWLLLTSTAIYQITEKKNNRFEAKILTMTGGHFFWSYNDKTIYLCNAESGLYKTEIVNDTIGRLHHIIKMGCRQMIPDQYKENLFWVAGNDGLAMLDMNNGQLKIFNEKSGINNSFIYSIIQKDSTLWMSTNGGLCRATLLYHSSPYPRMSFTNFTSNENLQGEEYNTNSYWKGKSGLFYFGGINGLNWFKPSVIRVNPHLPHLLITSVLVSGKPANKTISAQYIDTLHLDYRNQDIHITFSATEFTSPERNQYAYRVLNYQNNWIYIGNAGELRLNHLPPGQYTLEIKATNNDGLWMKQARTLQIEVSPPIWQTISFRILIVLLFAGSTVTLTRMMQIRKYRKTLEQLRRTQALADERERISRDMHDDIGTGLTQIALMSESAKYKTKEYSLKELDEIAETSRELVSNMSEIIWSMRPENKNLQQLIAYLREQLNKLLEYASMEYTLELPENGAEISLTNEQKRNVLMIIKELVHNSVKHSGGSYLNIKARYQNGALHVTIQDNGTGFDPEKRYNGNGMRNISKRIEMVNGSLRFTNNNGTVAEVVIPL